MHYVYPEERIEHLLEMILTKMRKYGIQSSILTMLWMFRRNLVTKEKVIKAAEGKLENDKDWIFEVGSINDDLERFLTNLQNQKEMEFENVWSFFTPKLTNEELKLVHEGNEGHLNTYWDYFDGLNPDVDVEEMKKSDSKSKFVHGRCYRKTISLKTAINRIEDEVSGAKKKRLDEKNRFCCIL